MSDTPEKSGDKKYHRRRRFHKNHNQNKQENAAPTTTSPNQPTAQSNNKTASVNSAKPNDNQNQKSSSHQQNKKNRNKQKNHREKPPVWGVEESFKAPAINESKEELLKILADVNPEELLMSSLIQKRRPMKVSLANPETPAIESNEPTVTIDMVSNCPICGKPIREIMYALHDYDHDKLAHFDCVFRKVSENVKDKLIEKRYLAYLGSGAFGIMETVSPKSNKTTLIEKIYPGAPVEELLHAEENLPDEEL
ncbi:MAG: hypothetical protein ACRC9L_02280 [Brevinema sp.]